MQVDEIKSLDNRAQELIQGISAIKEELNKKISERVEFKLETSKIVDALNQFSNEMKTLPDLFEMLSQTEQVKLYEKMTVNNNDFADEIVVFSKMVDQLSKFKATLIEGLEEINNVFKVLDARIDLLENKIDTSDLQQIELFEKSDVKIDFLEKKLDTRDLQQKELLGKIDTRIDVLESKQDTSDLQQKELLGKIDTRIDVLESKQDNSDLLQKELLDKIDTILENSRSGLFGRKK
jgi:regulator of replication initiation timing